MHKLLLILPVGNEPKSVRIATALRTAIQEERLKPGDKLPSSRDLAKELGIHRQTILMALDELVAEGCEPTSTADI